MPASTAKRKMLRNRAAPELRERGRYDIIKLTRRLLRTTSGEIGDHELMTASAQATTGGSAIAASTTIAPRRETRASAAAAALAPGPRRPDRLFPTAGERLELVDLAWNRFAGESEAVIARAERAIKLRFDVLGHHALSFGDPIDWRLDPLSGKRTGLEPRNAIDYLDPVIAGDQRITLELNRCGHFVTCGQAYWLTRDERFAQVFVEHANSWMDSNPVRRGINWSSCLEVSYRAIAWLWALHLMVDADAVTPPFVTRLVRCLLAHGRHIAAYLSHPFSLNTQLTGEALGLVYLAAALPELSHSRRWRLKGLSILFDQCARHFGPDGVHVEQSNANHRYATDSYIHLLLLARSSRLVLPPEIEMRLSSALDYLMWIVRPDGTSPVIGDDDGGRLLQLGERRSNDCRDTLATGAALFERGDWKHVAGLAPMEILWLLGPPGLQEYDRLAAVQTVAKSRSFDEAGYFVMRDGWDEDSSYALIDCGPLGAQGVAHAHADALSIEFAARGIPWLIDPGTFTYTGDPLLRDWFRSTGAHNTVTVDGLPQSVPGGPFEWESAARPNTHEFFDDGGVCYFEGSHDGYTRLDDPVTHVRSVLFVRSEGASSLSPYLVVRDAMDAAGHHRYAARFQLPADCVATRCRNTITASAQRGEKLAVFCRTDGDHVVDVTSGWMSSSYGQRRGAPAIVVECEGRGPRQIVSLLLPQSKSGGFASVSHARGVYSISTADSFDLIACPAGPEARSALLHSRCRMALARFIGGRLSNGCLIRGSRLSIVGGLSLKSPTPIPWLTFNMTGDQLRLRTRGAAQIEMTLAEPTSFLTVNDTNFRLDLPSRRLTLTLASAGWRLDSGD